jgi:hypothetical protein
MNSVKKHLWDAKRKRTGLMPTIELLTVEKKRRRKNDQGSPVLRKI